MNIYFFIYSSLIQNQNLVKANSRRKYDETFSFRKLKYSIHPTFHFIVTVFLISLWDCPKIFFCRKSKSKILQSSKLRIWTLFTQYEWQVLQCLNSDKTKDLLLWQLSHRPFPPFFHLFFLMHSQPLIILFISERKFIGKTNNDAACLTWATLD